MNAGAVSSLGRTGKLLAFAATAWLILASSAYAFAHKPATAVSSERTSWNDNDLAAETQIGLLRFYEPNLQRWLNQDPIGERGGINLYGFARNNPINGIDPFGLEDFLLFDPNPPSYRSVNYVKGFVGCGNLARGAVKGAQGALELSVGLPALVARPGTGPLAPVAEAGAVLVTAKGAADVTGAYFLARRGASQLGESSVDPTLGHLKNLLGLLPFGQYYDDLGESIRGAWENFKNLSLWEKIGEFFTS